ncbi:hypothetical protein MACH09_33020 [Vibrio sp. MACH09]|uniref:DUF4381 domain-containing protein n=1 Tax=unclassified Vibrio TaxID=2614977 RepID=UPI0014932C8E|nr:MULTISPECIES: DUF4381 domain-containing protein [unclassified Vibrio]NOI67891.1 DUF4381 domain-containing protein [Vibrio sp. 99-8-1]GLO62794.1 hypothetical protein MACH09_33020 [Vibrio sp. MACH09]
MTETTTNISHPLSLQSIHLPEPPTFWPVAWGWWSLLAAAILLILVIVGTWRWRKNRLRAKKAALALLTLEKSTLTPSGAMEIVRQAVLSYYPRSRVAHLSGDKWLQFLDSQVSSAIFSSNQSQWLEALYQKESHFDREEMIKQCDHWLTTALPPKRGGRG